MDGLDKYDALTDARLWTYLDNKAEKSKEVVSLDKLDRIVAMELKIYMADLGAKSRIENSFVSYHSLLLRHDISWVFKDNQKVTVYHVFLAIRPESL